MKEKIMKKVEIFAEIYMTWGIFAVFLIGPFAMTLIIMFVKCIILKEAINIGIIF